MDAPAAATPWEKYRTALIERELASDAAQAAAARELTRVYAALGRKPRPGWWARLRGVGPEPVRGLYMWGGVGRGKTWLMDLFYESLPFDAKGRWHFHRFMYEVHGRLRTLKHRRDPLRTVARDLARQTRIICFDEFFVSDIADAMLLGGLLEQLFAAGVSLVATSNAPPDELYKDGLQRARFLPAIGLLKRHTQVLNVDGGVDYRLRALERAEIYHAPLDAAADENLGRYFREIAGDPGAADITLAIENRTIPARRCTDGVAWFDFGALCDGPRSQADYIEIARLYHSVLVSNVPQLTPELENQARRFIALVDEFYDRNVKLILSAAVPLEQLYTGSRLRFEFERTRSRLEEMQSHDYLAQEHLP